MCVETVIGLPNQLPVEAPLIDARFIAGYQQDRGALHIECERYSPFAACGAEAKLFHIRMPRILQSVNMWSFQVRAELFKEESEGEDLDAHIIRQYVELRFELVANLNTPSHTANMTYTTYDVKIIYGDSGAL